MNVSTLEASINPGVTVTNDGIHTQYIEAAVEKTTITVDQTMDKSSTSGADFIILTELLLKTVF